MQRLERIVLAAAAVFAVAVSASAQDQKPPAKQPSIYDKIWTNLTDWYSDKENPVVQRVLFTGRFQHDLAIVESDQGDHKESNIRRVRFGPRITFFRDYLFHAEIEVNPQERNPFYVRFTDLYVAWQKNPKSVIQVGKQSIPFTQEGATSSKELITIDRSNLANNIWFTQEYMPGVSLSGRAAPWNYRAGVYSSGEKNRELGEFNGGLFTLLLVGYDFGKKLGVREATLTANYLYQHPDHDLTAAQLNNLFTKKVDHTATVHFKLEQPKWGFRGDVSKTSGYSNQPDILGMMAMPYYNFTDKWQAVLRYTFLDSESNGLILNTYENKIVSGRGDEYRETYVGLNYFLYGHRLKIQTGLQFVDMADAANDGGAFSGTSWTTGFRVGW
jgi:phosphate-selective porin OprO and OprP